MPDQQPHVVTVNVVHEIRRGPIRDTAIDKRPVRGPVRVDELGLAGDMHCDSSHGGVDKALYAYASEDAEWWARTLNREIGPGLFGENLTMQGLDISRSVIGEQWRLGSGADAVMVEVRMPRTPCGNLSARVGVDRFHQQFAATGRVGAYLSVVSAGAVSEGDVVHVECRPDHGVTVADWCCDRSVEKAQRLLESGIDLAGYMRRSAAREVRRARA